MRGYFPHHIPQVAVSKTLAVPPPSPPPSHLTPNDKSRPGAEVQGRQHRLAVLVRDVADAGRRQALEEVGVRSRGHMAGNHKRSVTCINIFWSCKGGGGAGGYHLGVGIMWANIRTEKTNKKHTFSCTFDALFDFGSTKGLLDQPFCQDTSFLIEEMNAFSGPKFCLAQILPKNTFHSSFVMFLPLHGSSSLKESPN